jgi:hypothetical protein
MHASLGHFQDFLFHIRLIQCDGLDVVLLEIIHLNKNAGSHFTKCLSGKLLIKWYEIYTILGKELLNLSEDPITIQCQWDSYSLSMGPFYFLVP